MPTVVENPYFILVIGSPAAQAFSYQSLVIGYKLRVSRSKLITERVAKQPAPKTYNHLILMATLSFHLPL